jgi:ankyrin repeat protein
MQEMLDLLDSSKKMLQVADINTKGSDNWTALHYAANEGHGDILEVLIDKNIDVEALTNLKRTALHLAAARGNIDICRLLCD